MYRYFAFAAGLSFGSGFVIPVTLGLVLGVVPAVVLCWRGKSTDVGYYLSDTSKLLGDSTARAMGTVK